MACVNDHHTASSTFPDGTSSSFTRARRPALIPSNCSLSLAEAEDLVRTRIQQPLFPPPDPRLFRNSSPTDFNTAGPEYPNSIRSTTSMPSSKGRHARIHINWVKAQAHYARDRNLRSCSPLTKDDLQGPNSTSQKPDLIDIGPKRKHSTPVVEEEFMCHYEDREGPPHPCETGLEDDETIATLNLEEEGNNVVALGNGLITMTPRIVGTITSEPAELGNRQ